MDSGKTTKLQIPALSEFQFQIKYTETNKNIHTHEIDIHKHDEFEIYVNLSGDVSFLVENDLYNLARGDVIIARPGEYHHCVYRSDATHKLFWILFDSQHNSHIFDFLKDNFRENFISPRADLREELLELCSAMHTGELTDEDKLYSFFRILAILKKSRSDYDGHSDASEELATVIDYINAHIYEEITVADISRALFVSQKTLERKFKEMLNITPLEFIRRRKLMSAAEMLQNGESVLSAGINVGYNDTSYFIELFKKYYSMTPYQYKKAHRKQ
jgi:AraC-like DNA-binding protein/quercetin dioxygenase-like cupin family protein